MGYASPVIACEHAPLFEWVARGERKWKLRRLAIKFTETACSQTFAVLLSPIT